MYKNSGKRDILIFPKFNNIDKIQEIRKKYDPLADLVPPHITLVFPFTNTISNSDLIDKLGQLLSNFEKFDISFSGISLSNDNYIFLNCTKGYNKIINLHNEIYKKILPTHLNSKIEYIPHITLGRSNDISDLKDFNETFSYTVDEITIEQIGKNEESVIIKNIKLGV